MSVQSSNSNLLTIPSHKEIIKRKLSHISKLNTSVSITPEFNGFDIQNSSSPIYSDFLRSKDVALFKGNMPGEFEENSLNLSQNDETSSILYFPQSPSLCPKMIDIEVSECILS